MHFYLMLSHPLNSVFWNWQPSTSMNILASTKLSPNEYISAMLSISASACLRCIPARKFYNVETCIRNVCVRASDLLTSISAEACWTYSLWFQVIAIQIVYDNPLESAERLFGKGISLKMTNDMMSPNVIYEFMCRLCRWIIWILRCCCCCCF